MNIFKVGDKVFVNDSCHDWRLNAPRETTVLGIMGKNEVFVFMPSEYGGYPRRYDGALYSETWNVLITDLELINSGKPVPAYTMACRFCSKPARKIGKALFCSNDRCKSRNRFKKIFPIPYYSAPKDVDADNFVICHECKERFNLIYDGITSPFKLKCKNGHMRKHTYLEGQKLANQEGSRIVSYVYRDNNFIKI